MRIQENGMHQQFSSIAQNQPKDRLTALQNRLALIEKQIEKVKENERMSAEEKKSRIETLETNKEELRILIEEEQINKKMSELDEKIEKAEASKAAEDDQPITPQDEIEAELGLNEVQSEMMWGISKYYDRAQKKLAIARNLRAEARIQNGEIKMDRGRGQSIGTKDYKVQHMISNRTTADRVEQSAFIDNGKAIKAMKKANEFTEEVQDKNEEIKDQIEEKQEDKKIDVKEVIGSHVDVKL